MHVRVLVTSLVLVLCAVTLVACKSQTKLGATCSLHKPNPDGGATPVLVTLDDIASISNQDLISFGAVECDADACVVDASNLEKARADAKAGTGAIIGYCSTTCTIGADDTKQCSPQQDDLQKKAGNAMHCRQLLLDQATLNAICTTDEICEAYFGTTRDKVTADFCSRGTADAGT